GCLVAGVDVATGGPFAVSATGALRAGALADAASIAGGGADAAGSAFEAAVDGGVTTGVTSSGGKAVGAARSALGSEGTLAARWRARMADATTPLNTMPTTTAITNVRAAFRRFAEDSS